VIEVQQGIMAVKPTKELPHLACRAGQDAR
jgi:hypothetical protein